MKPKKIENLFKSFFYFNNQERKGFTALLILIAFVIFLPDLYSMVFPPPVADLKIFYLRDDSIKKSSDSLVLTDIENLKFDPNTATDKTFRKLGMSESNIQTIQHFKEKGGQFRFPKDLNKIYGLEKELIAKLIPQVHIGNVTDNKILDTSFKKCRQQYPIELNGADSTQIVSLYKIGPALTHRILDYRYKLGGFIHLNQLTEVWGFDIDLLYDLEGKIIVNPDKARRYSLNKVRIEELKTHPYFKYKISQALINYRTQHGFYKRLQDLKNIPLVNDSVYQRITMYIILEE